MNSRKIIVTGLTILVLPSLAWSVLPQNDGDESAADWSAAGDLEHSGATFADGAPVSGSSTAAILVAQVAPAVSATDEAQSDAPRPEFIVPTHVVNTPALRVRFSPNTSDRIAVVLYDGTEVQLLEEAGDWAHVAYDSKGVVRTGWALSRLIVERSMAGEPRPVTGPQVTARPAPLAEPRDAATTPPLVSGAPLDQAPQPERLVATHLVDTEALRVRFTPDTDSRIAVILYAGDEVQELESADGWTKVAYESNGFVRTGWAVSRLLVDRAAVGQRRPRDPSADRLVTQTEDQDMSRPEPVAAAAPTEPEPEIPPLITSEPLPMAETETAPAPAKEPARAPATLTPVTQPQRIVPTHIVGANSMRLRLMPEASAGIAVVLKSGEEVQLLESAGEWTQVAYEDDGVIRKGWVASGLIVERSAKEKAATVDPAVSTAKPPVSAAADQVIAPTHIVISEVLRVRLLPDRGEPVAETLYAGDSVQLLENAGDWSNVAYDSDGAAREGWVLSRLIVERQPALPDTVARSTPDSQKSPESYASGSADITEARTPTTTRAPMISSSRLVTTHIVKGNMAQVRLQPNYDSGIRDILGRGHEMRKLQTSGAWTRIAYHSDGVTRSGWLLSSQIKEL